jgi:hypothetical protein
MPGRGAPIPARGGTAVVAPRFGFVLETFAQADCDLASSGRTSAAQRATAPRSKVNNARTVQRVPSQMACMTRCEPPGQSRTHLPGPPRRDPKHAGRLRDAARDGRAMVRPLGARSPRFWDTLPEDPLEVLGCHLPSGPLAPLLLRACDVPARRRSLRRRRRSLAALARMGFVTGDSSRSVADRAR